MFAVNVWIKWYFVNARLLFRFHQYILIIIISIFLLFDSSSSFHSELCGIRCDKYLLVRHQYMPNQSRRKIWPKKWHYKVISMETPELKSKKRVKNTERVKQFEAFFLSRLFRLIFSPWLNWSQCSFQWKGISFLCSVWFLVKNLHIDIIHIIFLPKKWTK